MSIPLVLRQRAAELPHAPAIAAPGAAPITYAELDAFVERTAKALGSLDLSPGDRIALTGPNGPEMATAFLAVASAASCAPLNPAYTEAEFQFYLSDLQPRAILVPSGSANSARLAAAALNIRILELRPGHSPGFFDLPNLSGQEEYRDPAGHQEALVLHTSGTTSRPKQVPLTHANLLHSAATVSAGLCLRPSDRCLNVMPLFHVHGLVAALLASLHAGASISCAPGFVPSRFWQWIESERATWFTAAPAIHQAVLAEQAGPHSLRFIRSCSAPLAPALMDALEQKLSIPVIEAYGMTEAAHQMASNPLPPGVRKPGSVGRATGCDIAILDERSEVLPPGSRGSIAIRGPGVTQGYCNNPEANASSFTNGWFRTGDEGYLDAEGYLYLTGRTKEFINRGGEKIAPREIYEVLLLHPAVAQALAFSVPHPELGETVAAAVVLKRGENVPDLRSYLAAKLSYFKVPEQFVFLDDLPKGPTGKPQRIGLAAKLGVAYETTRSPRPPFVPPRNEREAELASTMQKALRSDNPIGVCDNFFTDLGGTSLSAAALLARIEETTGITVTAERFYRRPTIEGLVDAICGTGDGDGLLIPIRPFGSLPPLLCIPGAFGELSVFHQLARKLNPDRPVYAFRMPAAVGALESYSVETIADRYWTEWGRVGAVAVMGVCAGAPFALELAHRVRDAGGKVSLVVLFDSYNQAALRGLSSAEMRFLRLQQLGQRLQFHWRAIRGQNLLDYAKPRVEAFRRLRREEKDQRQYEVLVAAGKPLPEPLRNSACASRYAVKRYQPRPWNGPALLLRVEEPRDGAYAIDRMGWGEVFKGGLVMRDVQGGHVTALSDPYVSEVARCIESELLDAAV